MVVVYGAQPVEALFHSDCGGETTAADAVWGGTPVPYLIPRVDDVPATAHRHWEYVTTAEKVRLALNADRRSEIGRRLTAIEVLTRDASGRAATIAVRGERSKTLRGDELRAILSAAFGARSIQSTLLTITKKGSNYVFDGTGFGHGVGLCQRGAMARARAGQSIEQIIRAYFTGASVAHADSRD
jgi:stage II sporulation protein D